MSNIPEESRVVTRGREYDITKLDDTKLHSLRAELLEESDSCGPTQDTGNPSALLDCLKIAKEFKRRREAAGESTQERVDSTRQMVQKLQEQVQALTLEVEKLRDRTQSLVGRVPDKPPTVESEHGTFVLTDVLRAALCARPSDEEMEAIMRGTHVHGVPDLSEYQDSERRGQDDGK